MEVKSPTTPCYLFREEILIPRVRRSTSSQRRLSSVDSERGPKRELTSLDGQVSDGEGTLSDEGF